MQPSRCQPLLNLSMKVAAKCQITLFYPLPHSLRERKPKSEPVLQQFNCQYHPQQPVTHAQRLATRLLTSFFNFLPVPDGYPDTQFSQTSRSKVIAGSFLAFPLGDEQQEWEVFGWHLLHSYSPYFQVRTPEVSVLIQEGLPFIWGHSIVTGISPGRFLCKPPAFFTWNLH